MKVRVRTWASENPEKKKSYARRWNAKHPEHASVRHHWWYIHNPNIKGHKNYEGMPFFEKWNPDKGGSFQAGADWIIANLGKRPQGCSLHIVDHVKGFVPGNLEWATKKTESTEQMFKIIANQRHEIERLRQQLQELQIAA